MDRKRASTMNMPEHRFPTGEDIQEKILKVLAVCEQCGEPLREGEYVIRDFDGYYFCDTQCLLEWLGSEGAYYVEVLGRE